MITPIFKGLRGEGGTFYTFQPAMKDMTLMFSNDTNIKMNFSKFVCVKLPEWGNIDKQSLYIDPNKLESLNDNSTLDNANEFFVKRYLQNYTENLNTHFDTNRIDDNFANTSELALIKSLTSLTDNTTPPLQLGEYSTYLTEDNISNTIFRELEDSPQYNQFIQFIGDINLMNHVQKDGQEYLEMYAHIPTSSGKTIDTQFIKNNSIKPTLGQIPLVGTEWIAGQETVFTNAPTSDKSYAKSVYDTVNLKYDVNAESDLLKIDWNDLENPESKYKFDNGNFEFNAILVYYDIFDVSDESTVERNLYGILILDSFKSNSPTTQEIPTFKKYQPNENQSGNSFGFRFNMMFSNSTNTAVSSCTINDYSTISMELYMEAMEELKKVAISYSEIQKIYFNLANNFSTIEQTILQLKTFSQIDEIESINSKLKNFVTIQELDSIINAALEDKDIVTIDEVQTIVDQSLTGYVKTGDVYTKSQVYSKSEVDNKLTDIISETEVDLKLEEYSKSIEVTDLFNSLYFVSEFDTTTIAEFTPSELNALISTPKLNTVYISNGPITVDATEYEYFEFVKIESNIFRVMCVAEGALTIKLVK